MNENEDSIDKQEVEEVVDDLESLENSTENDEGYNTDLGEYYSLFYDEEVKLKPDEDENHADGPNMKPY
jgi:hypothetical protein